MEVTLKLRGLAEMCVCVSVRADTSPVSLDSRLPSKHSSLYGLQQTPVSARIDALDRTATDGEPDRVLARAQ